MGLYEDLKEKAVNLLCLIHMKSCTDRDNKYAILDSFWLFENSMDSIKQDIIKYYEEQILTSDEILPESVYKSVLNYYKYTSSNNTDVINKILSQSKKNKFKKYDSNTTILSIEELEKRLS